MARITRGISLEDWEEKTQLGENELQSVYDLQEACAELPLPAGWVKYILYHDNFWLNQAQVYRQAVGLTCPCTIVIIGHTHTRLVFLRNCSSHSSQRRCTFQSLNATHQTPAFIHQPFGWSKRSWFSCWETLHPRHQVRQAHWDTAALLWLVCRHGIRHGERSGGRLPVQQNRLNMSLFGSLILVFRNYLMLASLYRKSCDEFLEDLVSTCGLLNDLRDEYGFVEKQTRSLQSACEALLDEQVSITKKKKEQPVSSLNELWIRKTWQLSPMVYPNVSPTSTTSNLLQSSLTHPVMTFASIQSLLLCYKNSMNVLNTCSNTLVTCYNVVLSWPLIQINSWNTATPNSIWCVTGNASRGAWHLSRCILWTPYGLLVMTYTSKSPIR